VITCMATVLAAPESLLWRPGNSIRV
jgi:hypothetical protein